MDRETALRKIQKCLNLSKSPEPLEAARAMAQAQKLMEQFNVEHPELLAVGVLEAESPSRATKTPPSYEVQLAHVVAESFGCNTLFASGAKWAGASGMYRFIGVGTAAEVAGYTFDVLARKLRSARAEYTQAKLSRYTKNKVAAADEFCRGWVRAIALSVPDAPVNESSEASRIAYMSRQYPELESLSARRRELSNAQRALDHRVNGFIEGKKAHVNTGIGSAHGLQHALSFEQS